MERERIIITVRPGPSADGLLKVADAMQQVMDVLKLLESAARSLDADPVTSFEWRLESASTNSPFTVVAVAEARNPTVDVGPNVRKAKHEAALALRAAPERRGLPAWLDPDGTVALRGIYQRTLGGIASTAIDFDGGAASSNPVTGQVEVAREGAEAAIAELRAAMPLSDFDAPARIARGELNGRLVAVGRYRKRPAFQIQNPLYGTVWCLVPNELVDELGGEHTLGTVWRGRAVAVDGRLVYAPGGRLVRVDVDTIRQRSTGRETPLTEVLDPDFTAGLDPIDYIERLHGGSLG